MHNIYNLNWLYLFGKNRLFNIHALCLNSFLQMSQKYSYVRALYPTPVPAPQLNQQTSRGHAGEDFHFQEFQVGSWLVTDFAVTIARAALAVTAQVVIIVKAALAISEEIVVIARTEVNVWGHACTSS